MIDVLVEKCNIFVYTSSIPASPWVGTGSTGIMFLIAIEKKTFHSIKR